MGFSTSQTIRRQLRFEFARKIAEFSKSSIKLNPLTTEQYLTPAQRPVRSTMSLDKIEEVYKIEPKHWENSLEECVDILFTLILYI